MLDFGTRVEVLSHQRPRLMMHSFLLLRAAALWLVLPGFLWTAGATSQCADVGSIAQAAAWENGPPLSCSSRMHPAWRQWTPPHRMLAPVAGMTPGEARSLPRFHVQYRCTGLPFWPVVIATVRISGYVVDVPQHPCLERSAQG